MKICAWCGERASYQFVQFERGETSYPPEGRFCGACMWDSDVTKPNLPIFRRMQEQ